MNNFSVLTISEGAAGMRSQIEGLAKIIGTNYLNFDLEIKPFFRRLPIQLIPASPFAYKNLSEIKINTNTIIISCGKKSVKASIYLKKKFKEKIFNIHIQDPKSQRNKFDLIICPEHDKLDLPNSISTQLALHNIEFKKDIKKNDTVNFILGGKNKYFNFHNETHFKIIDDILKLSKNYKVNVIPSRRTPSELINKLIDIKNKNLFIFKELFSPKKYGDLLSTGSIQIVTWDSISMISESISSGIGTYVYKFEEHHAPERYNIFYQNLISRNYIRFFDDNLIPFEVNLDNYNNELKTKILNKIKSNLRFQKYAS